MIEALLRRVFRHSDITHAGSLYLRRFFLGPSVRGWQLMLHKIARPDLERVLHDHPWDFVTLCLRGGYMEAVAGPGGIDSYVLSAGMIRFRAAEHTHRIDRILGSNAWTLILAGPRRRIWGFWKWGEFIAADDYFKDGYGKKSEPARAAA